MVKIMEKKLLEVQETADILKVSLRTMRTIIKNKKIKIIRVEGGVRIHPDDLQDYINSNRE
jgi:excisionase family DNA binding protein